MKKTKMMINVSCPPSEGLAQTFEVAVDLLLVLLPELSVFFDSGSGLTMALDLRQRSFWSR